jgi:DNA replication protein DnaC
VKQARAPLAAWHAYRYWTRVPELVTAIRHTKTGWLLSDLGGGRADGAWEQRLRGYLRQDLHILDDFGLRSLPPQRHQTGSTIVISNRPPENQYELLANPVLAESILDRLVNSAHHVLMDGKSYRSVTRPGPGSPRGKGGDGPQAD